jgi:c-di-GMP-binding flagellar brake protein YcgR
METNQPDGDAADALQDVPIPHDYGKRNPLEIGVALQNLLNRGDLVDVHYEGGQLLARLLDVNVASRAFVFDRGDVERQNIELLASQRNEFSAQPDGVRLKFATPAAEEVEFQGKRAFQSAFPEVLYYMQRREYFRVGTPVLDPFMCRGRWPDGVEFQYEVQDISLGGVALRCADDKASELALETVLRGVTLDVEGHGQLTLDLQLVSCRAVEFAQDGTRYQLGLRFVSLPGHVENTLQRIVTQLEMKRRALTR